MLEKEQLTQEHLHQLCQNSFVLANRGIALARQAIAAGEAVSVDQILQRMATDSEQTE